MTVRVGRRHVLGALGALTLLAACSSTTTGDVSGDTPEPVPGTPAPMRVPYGPDPGQVGDLHLPPGDGAPLPVVVVIHGGYWRAAYGLELGTPLAVDLTNAGVAAWNIEYRRVGAGGGFPATFADVAAAVDALAGDVQRAAGGRLDLGRVVVLGHSAGGQLAVWAASRGRLPDTAPGARPRVVPRGAVAQAGVLDLVAGADQGLGGGAVLELLGGPPAAVPDRYAQTSPVALVPPDAPVVCVHGRDDVTVPPDQSERYVTAAGGRARLVLLDGKEHFALIDPDDDAWTTVRGEVLGLL